MSRPGRMRGLAVLVGIALAGCAPQRQPVIPRAAFVMREAHRDAIEGRDTTLARLVYPEFVGARTPEALDSLRATVHALLVAPVAGRRQPAASLAGLMEGFIDDWNAARKAERRRVYWRLERRVEVLGETLGVVSLAATDFASTGGAHSMTTRKLLMLGADDGRARRFAEVFRAEARDSLGDALEQDFRAARAIGPDSSIASAGFRFPNGHFLVNDNVAVAPDGVHWRFDSGEIGPDSLGPTDLIVPFDEVRPFARAGSPLAPRDR
jgi:hypothetical protein